MAPNSTTMAAVKRAADAEKANPKGGKHSTDDRAAKRPRNLESATKTSRTSSSHSITKHADTAEKPSRASILKNEERSFPRGGASVLSPLERKQIQIEATNDVLFEQSGNKGLTKDVESGDEMDISGVADPAIKKSKKKRKNKGDPKEVEDSEPRLKVEGLSFRRLVPGSMVLGRVMQITSRDIALALPNNLVGYIPLTAVSDQLTTRLEKLLAEDDDNDTSENEEEDENIDLHKLVSVGQYLRAYVQSTAEDSTTPKASKSKKRIELSIQPRLANSGIRKQDIVVSSMVQASVVSVEDHGLVMDLGLNDPSVKGFMSSKEVGFNIDHTNIEPGAVFLCLVIGLTSDNNIVKLSADHRKAGDIKKKHFLTDAPNVDMFLPGVAVEMLVTNVTATDLAGQIMGMLDATADVFHSGAALKSKDLDKQYKIGSRIKVRIISKVEEKEKRVVGVTLLDHVICLSDPKLPGEKDSKAPQEALPLSSIIEEAKVVQVYSKIGLFLNVNVKGVLGFAHISRLSDSKVDSLSSDSGSYKVGSTHRARVISFNPMDSIYVLSLEQHVLEQPFLRIEDITVGQLVKGKVERLVTNAKGVGGVLVNLAEGITGLVPEMHMADIALQHPEKKFREGLAVKAKVISTNPEKRLIRLTLKKTLVNSDIEPWVNYNQIQVGDQAPGTIVNILSSGAVVQFFGDVRAFLPVSEMSEAYIKDPTLHFKVGQVVTVRVTDVDSEQGKMIVSCRDPSRSTTVLQDVLQGVPIGAIVDGVVTEKSADGSELSLELDKSGLKSVLRVGQLTDGSESKNLSALKRIRVGQKLQDLVVIEKLDKRPVAILSNKPSILKHAKEGTLVSKFADVKEGDQVAGFVRNITADSVFVQFGGGVVGLLLRSHIEESLLKRPDFGLVKDSSITARVLAVDGSQQRFLLTMRPLDEESKKSQKSSAIGASLTNPVDESIASVDDFTLGKVTKARITSVKDTQLNVKLADKVQGRIDFSEVFDDWESIQDPKHPLKQFKTGQELTVKVLGIHDARSHRFLPITHRGKTTPVFELTAKPTKLNDSTFDVLTLDKVAVGASMVAFVNNISHNCVWVNLSPNVRGRISFMDLTDDISQLNDVPENFPIGSAVHVRVRSVDLNANHIDLAATSSSLSESLAFEDVTKGMNMAGRVTKVTERHVLVKLGSTLSGLIPLTELTDDFTQANPTIYNKNDIIRVRVVAIDTVNKHIYLSVRPSHILSSSLPVKDPHIDTIEQLKVNQVVRGFVKNVADKGVFVTLGPKITAFVRISDLSDSYVKDWKSIVEIDQLVKGKVLAVDAASNHILLSIKPSLLDQDYVAPINYDDIAVGQIFTAKVRKVENFGVFIVLDNSNNVSGICHRSEIADEKVDDARKLYEEGDHVKAIVLKVEKDKRRVNFGLKASYFEDEDEPDTDEQSQDESEDGGMDLDEKEDLEQILEDDSTAHDAMVESDTATNVAHSALVKPISALSVGGFDWTGNNLDDGQEVLDDESSVEDTIKRKKNKKPQVKVDKTGDLDAHGPQSVADFERLLLGQPNSSSLWVQYMAFQLQLNEVEKAREIAERALKTINIQEQEEKSNVWIALLNLENAYGTDDSVDEVFKRACQYNDVREIHEALVKIYIDSTKNDKADTLFQAMTKQKQTTIDPRFWINYATFLMTTINEPQRARSLLQRATQSVHPRHHRDLTSKFGALEFKSANGDSERGRTIFEGLLSTFPKRYDLWDIFIALELAKGEVENARALYDRLGQHKMKGSKAKAMFKRWLDFEEKHGSNESVEQVKRKAAEYVEKLKNEADGED